MSQLYQVGVFLIVVGTSDKDDLMQIKYLLQGFY